MRIHDTQPVTRAVQPTNPYHISRAYGVIAPVGPAPTEPRANVGDVRPEGPSRLIAAVVPGGVEFARDGQAQPTRPDGAFPMYRHPADKNAAATAVNVGRSLDVRG